MSGFIYAIECNGRIKIGFSEKPEQRFSKIASDSPFACALLGYWPGTVSDELDVHSKFNATRAHGEWFAVTTEILDFIGQNAVAIVKKGKHKIVHPSDSALKAWRKNAGLRQQDFAGMLGVNTAFVSQLETGLASPSLKVAVKIVEICGDAVPLNTLLGKTEAAS